MTTRQTDTVCGLATAAGQHRSHNEDTALTGPDWYVVADGMGGHALGDLASRVVVETFASARLDPAAVVDSIHLAVAAANTNMRTRARECGAAGMGSTVVGLTSGSGGGPIAVFHAGDARCYRLTGGELRLMTRDHTHVQELVDTGRITAEQAARHPLRNVVTRAIGIDEHVRADVVLVEPGPNRFLLCSDGLTSELGPRVLGRVLSAIADPQAAADRLVELALDRPADDDVTALVVDVGTVRKNGDTPSRPAPDPR